MNLSRLEDLSRVIEFTSEQRERTARLCSEVDTHELEVAVKKKMRNSQSLDLEH